jgi:hypothetical protein
VKRVQAAAAVFVASVFVSCATPRERGKTTTGSPGPVARPGELLVRLSRDGLCFGFCPGYSVEVDVSGRVTYVGGMNVLTVGTETAQLQPQALAALRRAIADSGLNALPDHCCHCYGATDSDTVTVTIADGSAPKVVDDYQGCPARSKRLDELEAAIDRIVGTETWIGSLADRDECFRSARSKPCSLGVKTLGPGHCSVLRGLFTQSSEEMASPSPWPGTQVTDSGNVGFLVRSIRSDSLYARCGFENGDVWVAVNGIPLSSPGGALKAYGLIRQAPSLAFSMLRRGQPMTIRVDLR